MFKVSSAFSQLLFSTVRIECQFQNGATGTGTAFFFTYQIEGAGELPLLVTNKHVIAGATIGQFYVHEAIKNSSGQFEPSPTSFSITLGDFEQRWFMHPDPAVDICVMPFEPLRLAALAKGKEIFNKSFAENLIPTQETLESLSALEDVAMVGYPIGLWDSTNNFPILRRGITASHPATDFQGKQQGVVDMACFPGSSGSPILILNEGGFATSQGFLVGNRAFLLGILFAGPVHTANGKIEVVQIPTHSIAISVTNIPIHLGYYVKASALARLKAILLEQWNLKTPGA